jgi:signal transduction histidine kinase
MNAKEIEDGFVLSFRNAQSRNELLVNSKNEDIVNRDKNNFLLKLTNDLKSPLQSIVGFSQAMADGLGGEMTEQQGKYIKIIRKNSSDLMYFIAKLLDFSNSEYNNKSPEYRTFDVINALTSVVHFNEQLYKGKELAWNINIEEGVKTPIYTDENMFKAIIQNVLEVVLKSVDIGDINVSLSSPDEEFILSKNLPVTDYILVNVSSSALLLSESDLECMFDPYKIIDTPNRKNILRAMTLACVKNLIQGLNGYIWVESKILKNTSFNILIPQNKN